MVFGLWQTPFSYAIGIPILCISFAKKATVEESKVFPGGNVFAHRSHQAEVLPRTLVPAQPLQWLPQLIKEETRIEIQRHVKIEFQKRLWYFS